VISSIDCILRADADRLHDLRLIVTSARESVVGDQQRGCVTSASASHWRVTHPTRKPKRVGQVLKRAADARPAGAVQDAACDRGVELTPPNR